MRSAPQERMLDPLARLHREEGGAVALLCLAAILILFMLAMIIFDAGHSAARKTDLQMASDSAAYSQASIKARSMNMVAFNNVVQRSIVGMLSMYHGMMIGYAAWVAKRCSECNPYNISACIDCAIDGLNLGLEAISDLPKTFGGDYGDDIDGIASYNQYMIDATPWLAWGEGVIRGSANGATMIGSFPPPPHAILTGGPDLLQQALTLFGGGTLYAQTSWKDGLPIEEKGVGTICSQMLDPFGVPEFGLEMLGNLLEYRSNSAVNADNGFTVGIGLGAMLFFCYAENAAPYELAHTGDGGEALAHKSYLTFGWKADPETQGMMRDKFNIIDKDYNQSLLKPAQWGSGFWSMARAEIVTPGTSEGMWHANWTAKMRPVALEGEFDDGGYSLKAAFHDVAPYMGLAAVLGVVTGPSTLTSSLGDFIAMEKAVDTMDNESMEGLPK